MGHIVLFKKKGEIYENHDVIFSHLFYQNVTVSN